MTIEELRELDAKRKEREDELVLLLLLLLAWGVEQSLVEGGTAALQPGTGAAPRQPAVTPATPRGAPPTAGVPTPSVGGNRLAAGILAVLQRILRTFGVQQIAESMADAHLDAFAVYEPATLLAPSRDALAEEYRPAAGEMVTAILQTLADTKAATVAEALLLAKYSRSDSTGLELGAERQIVTASNAGLIAGGYSAMGPRITGLRHRSVIDDRTTKICTDRDGLQLPLDDPYWLLNWPSLHWRCRSTIDLIIGAFKPSEWRPRTPPDVGFGRAPASVRRLLRTRAA